MTTIYEANVGEFLVRNTADKIVSFCEAKGYEAQRNKDERMMHYYWQIGEHWKHVQNNREECESISGNEFRRVRQRQNRSGRGRNR